MNVHNTESTEVRLPGSGMLIGAGALFLLFGTVVLAIRPDDDEEGAVVAGVLGVGFLVFGALALLPGIQRRASHRRIEHAPEGTCPEVPAEPLLAPGTFTLAGTTQRLAPDSNRDRGALEPIPGLLQRRAALAIGFEIALLAFVAWLTVVLDPPSLRTTRLSPFAARALLVGAMAFCMTPVLGFVLFVTSRHLSSRPTLRWDPERWELARRGETVAEGARDQLVAVQIVAARDITGTRDRIRITDALEVNLAWRNREDVVERRTLLRTNGAFDGALLTGSVLAAALDLPLLHHATPRHWAAERPRAKRRGPRNDDLLG